MFFSLNKAVSISAAVLALHSKAVSAFDNSRSDNLAIYWGQNSYGATHGSDTANWQKRLSFYCGSDSVINAIPVAFLTTFFAEGGLPSIDLSNICSTANNVSFPGTQLPECQSLAADIQTCQAAGKIVTISLGGASGAVGFTSDSQAQTFADTVWNLFLGGSSSTRPFGNAVLDGVDLDIEGGSSTGYAAFVNQIRSHAAGASKPYYITGAPQCPFPDASLGSVINAVGFDAVYVQFYNNFCGTQNFNNPNAWDFSTWDNWAKTTSPNKNVKVYLGVPASSTAAGSGYVDPGTLATIIQQTKSTYSSFGGVMMWDASQAYANNRYDISAKDALTGSASAPPPSSSPSTTPPSTTSKSTTTKSSTSSSASSTPTSGSCAGVAAWSSSIAYQGGSEVTYGGHLWTAKWWSQADVPGGVAGDWTDDGPCTSAQIVPLTAAAPAPAPVVSESPNAKPSPSPAHQANSAGVDSLSVASAATKLPTVSSPAAQSPKPATAASTKLPAVSSPAIQSPKPATAASTKLPTVSSPVPVVHSDLVTIHNNLSSQPIAATSGVPKVSSAPAASHAPASASAAVSKPNDSAAIAQSAAAVSGSGSAVISGSGSVAAVAPEVTQRNHARNFKY